MSWLPQVVAHLKIVSPNLVATRQHKNLDRKNVLKRFRVPWDLPRLFMTSLNDFDAFKELSNMRLGRVIFVGSPSTIHYFCNRIFLDSVLLVHRRQLRLIWEHFSVRQSWTKGNLSKFACELVIVLGQVARLIWSLSTREHVVIVWWLLKCYIRITELFVHRTLIKAFFLRNDQIHFFHSSADALNIYSILR